MKEQHKILLAARYKMTVQILKIMMTNTYLKTKILQYQMIRHLRHPKMTIITLPLMMTILMTQYSLATQSLSHSC